MDNKPHFHELTNKEYETLKNSGATWRDVMATYSQPDWCEYPNALEGIMGCWSLVSEALRKKISKEYCKNCDCFKVSSS